MGTLSHDAGYVDSTEAAQIFIPKAEHRGLDPAPFPERYAHRLNQHRDRWEAELGERIAGDTTF